MTLSAVNVVSAKGSVSCYCPDELSEALESSLIEGQYSTDCVVEYHGTHGIRTLSITYCRDRSMFETFGSRPVLDFDLLLSRIYWDKIRVKENTDNLIQS